MSIFERIFLAVFVISVPVAIVWSIDAHYKELRERTAAIKAICAVEPDHPDLDCYFNIPRFPFRAFELPELPPKREIPDS